MAPHKSFKFFEATFQVNTVTLWRTRTDSIRRRPAAMSDRRGRRSRQPRRLLERPPRPPTNERERTFAAAAAPRSNTHLKVRDDASAVFCAFEVPPRSID
uniref:Uncharacterized protein n=1 Tax=Steinernema glaseri TaxID=37863 RepID=A0A1I7YU24_9BILA